MALILSSDRRERPSKDERGLTDVTTLLNNASLHLGAVMQIWVYILKCADDSYYVGSHRGPDPLVRESEHNDGLNPKAYTYSRRPVTLVWNTEFEDPIQAISFEQQLKGWSRAKKEAVIRGDWAALPGLSRSRSRRR